MCGALLAFAQMGAAGARSGDTPYRQGSSRHEEARRVSSARGSSPARRAEKLADGVSCSYGVPRRWGSSRVRRMWGAGRIVLSVSSPTMHVFWRVFMDSGS